MPVALLTPQRSRWGLGSVLRACWQRVVAGLGSMVALRCGRLVGPHRLPTGGPP